MAKRALIVVARKPVAGESKTRLSPPLNPEQAVELYRCFLLDTFDLMRRVDHVQPVIAYTPDDAAAYFSSIAPAGFDLVPQVGKDLSQRLHNVLSDVLGQGYQQAVVMNSDSPTLPASYVNQAFAALDDPALDVVLGPSDDGGYYLIGLKRPCQALFDVAMSTSMVLADTLARARQQGLRVTCTPSWYDVDTQADLARLVAEISSLPPQIAWRTQQMMKRLATAEELS